MKVSIALCTYNGEDFLLDQLESFLYQTRLPDELVVSDDCSSDKTVTILNNFKIISPFPVLIHINKRNIGSTKNFEKAISLCSGDLIFLSDQDDVWMMEKILAIESEFKKSPEVGMVFSDAELVDEKLNYLGKNLWDNLFGIQKQQEFKAGRGIEVLQNGDTVAGATMAFRSKLREVCLPIPNLKNFIHDEWISFMASLFSDVIPLNKPLIKYRQHSKQQIGGIRKDVPATNSRPIGYSRQQTYQDAIERYKLQKNRVEVVKYHCEITLNNLSNSDCKSQLKKNPIEGLNQKENRLNEGILHNLVRRDMPRNRVKRVPKILSELIKGNYHSFSRGIKSAAVDLVEKIK